MPTHTDNHFTPTARARLRGYAAIQAAETDEDLILCSFSSPLEEGAIDIGAVKAREIAEQDPGLIFAASRSASPGRFAVELAAYRHDPEFRAKYNAAVRSAGGVSSLSAVGESDHA